MTLAACIVGSYRYFVLKMADTDDYPGTLLAKGIAQELMVDDSGPLKFSKPSEIVKQSAHFDELTTVWHHKVN